MIRAFFLVAAFCFWLTGLGWTSPLLGMFEQGDQRFLVRERAGQLELVFDASDRVDNPFALYSAFPLRLQSANSYQLIAYGPLRKETATVRFEQDRQGRAIAVMIGESRYPRKFFDIEEGKTFQIKSLLPADELRRRALVAAPPVESGSFVAADLVELISMDPTLKLDIRYAGTNNFMGMQLYDEPRAFLQRPAAEALVRMNGLLKKYGYGMIVYDAYRPWYVTRMFWDATPDSQKIFVADPAKGSRHNRGCAVDVGFYSLATGEPVDMGSDYDEFSMRAFPSYPGGTAEQRERRELLRLLMAGEGFTVYPEEWWHFDFAGWQKYPILNLRFDQL